MKIRTKYLAFLAALILCASAACGAEMTVTDCLGRSVTVPAAPERIIGSGSGALRLLTYLQANDRVIAVDSIEKRNDPPPGKASRPYALAHPEFAGLPLFGEFRGKDNPELIAGLSPQPQVIFKVSPLSGPHPDQLTAKTGIPVIGLEYGNLSDKKVQFYATLRLMGKVLDKEQRAEEVVAFFEGHLAELRRRTAGIPEEERRSCYIGGVSMRGTHGFTSTEIGYPPFLYTGAKNVAADGSGKSETVSVAKEKILQWDPQVVFMDINTLRAKGESAAQFRSRLRRTVGRQKRRNLERASLQLVHDQLRFRAGQQLFRGKNSLSRAFRRRRDRVRRRRDLFFPCRKTALRSDQRSPFRQNFLPSEP